MMYITIWFLVSCILGSTSALQDKNFHIEEHSKYNGYNTKTKCEFPFQLIGGFCFFMDNAALGTWDDARGFCQLLGGDLVDLKNANKLYEIAMYLKDSELADVSYWVGAQDLNSEGNWKWVSDNSPVRMGTPLWGQLGKQQPDGGSQENCAILSRSDFYYMHDDVCDFSLNGVICQSQCPPDYIMIGNTCLNIIPDAETSVTWYNAKAFCESQGAHLVKIDDVNFFGLIYDYLTENSITSSFHIDGNDEMQEGVWLFFDGSPVKRGTPFWNVNNINSQEPTGGIDQNCLYIRKYESYHLRDGGCSFHIGLICQYDV